MKNKLLFLLPVVVLLSQCAQAQSVEKYYYLAKIWGFAKYYHPTATECQINWDDVLLEKFNQLDQTEEPDVINATFQSLLDTLGPLEDSPGALAEVEDPKLNNLDLDWISDPYLSDNVQQGLSEIRSKMRKREQCSYETAFENGNLRFDKDDQYAKESNYPNKAKRFLAVARWWNAIEYLFPYKYQTDQAWNEVLQKYTLPVLEAIDETAYHLAMKIFTAQIDDAHAFFSSPIYFQKIRGYYYPPFNARYIENKVVITEVVPRKGIEVGEILLSIDGESVETLRERYWPRIEGSNPASKWRNFISYLLVGLRGTTKVVLEDKSGTTRELEILREQTNNAVLFEEPDNPVTFKTLHTPQGCEVGFVDMAYFTPEEVPAMFSRFKDLPGIILDIRNYPNGTMWPMVPFLYPNGVNLSQITNPEPSLPGRFVARQHWLGQPNNNDHYTGKLIFLFDERTQSQAEFTIMGLEPAPGGSLKIGSATAGADGNVSRVYLPGNIEVNFSGLGIYYPDGRETQRIGIVPDVELRPTIAGIRAGRDELLEYALQCVNFDATPPANYLPEIILSPNPVSETLRVNIGFDRQYTIEVFNPAGQLVRSSQRSGLDRIELNLKVLAAGVYTLRATDNEGNVTNLSFVKI